jgi:hypothetical protein
MLLYDEEMHLFLVRTNWEKKVKFINIISFIYISRVSRTRWCWLWRIHIHWSFITSTMHWHWHTTMIISNWIESRWIVSKWITLGKCLLELIQFLVSRYRILFDYSKTPDDNCDFIGINWESIMWKLITLAKGLTPGGNMPEPNPTYCAWVATKWFMYSSYV